MSLTFRNQPNTSFYKPVTVSKTNSLSNFKFPKSTKFNFFSHFSKILIFQLPSPLQDCNCLPGVTMPGSGQLVHSFRFDPVKFQSSIRPEKSRIARTGSGQNVPGCGHRGLQNCNHKVVTKIFVL